MTITAKFPGTCPSCGSAIQPGDKVEWSKGEKARHTSCPATASAPAKSAPAARRSSSYSYRRSGAGSAASVPGYSSYCTARPGCGCYDCAS